MRAQQGSNTSTYVELSKGLLGTQYLKATLHLAPPIRRRRRVELEVTRLAERMSTPMKTTLPMRCMTSRTAGRS
ncbi:hypothetical protein C0992_008842 [Termitomyces sp. T32_za158]|nr:hypothetical protein C0992_008842 [Termitomyces sp. T32_za158]